MKTIDAIILCQRVDRTTVSLLRTRVGAVRNRAPLARSASKSENL
jgi:hypothetical protein